MSAVIALLVAGPLVASAAGLAVRRRPHVRDPITVLTLVAVTAMAAWLLVAVERTVAVLGKVKSGSALLFDVGVTLIVTGLVVAVIGGLGGDDLNRPARPVPPPPGAPRP